MMLVPVSCASARGEGCNLLDMYSTQHEHMELIECGKHEEGQVLMSARYRVRGEHAAEVEQLLVESYGMGALRFACCGWDPAGKRGHIESDAVRELGPYHALMISMSGDAVRKDDTGREHVETDRGKIDFFEVEVELGEF